MKKLSRLTALVLALMLALSMSVGAWAEKSEDTNKAVYDAAVQARIADFPNLPVEEQYNLIMALGDTAETEALLAQLSEEQYNALVAYAVSLEEVVIPETVVFTAAGPFLPAVDVRPTRMFRLTRDAGTSRAQSEGLVTSKVVTGNATDGYKIRLESYVTGTTTTTTTTTTSPVDIVLVLDQSGSMAYGFDGNSTDTNTARRQYAMKQAVNNFIGEVAGKFTGKEKGQADHRMAIVTFGSSASTLQGWTYVDADGENALKTKIKSLPDSPSGATNIAAGMEMAETLMGSAYGYTGNNTTRQKVVIAFTDGVPTTNRDFETAVATSAIESAKKLKDSGVTVYTVGIFNGADPDELHGGYFDYKYVEDIVCTGEVGSVWGIGWVAGIFGGNDFPDIDIAAGNRFLNYLSSNFATSEKIGITKGTYDPGGTYVGGGTGYRIDTNYERTASNYYLTASNSASLNNIFQTISNNIQTGTASVNMGTETVVKDIVSDQFSIPEGTAGEIKVYTSDFTKDGTWTADAYSETLTAKVDVASDRTVTVDGFDYSKYYVDLDHSDGRDENDPNKDGGFYGRKLIIEIPIVVREGFLGGNGVYTNNENSGVYSGDTVVENFEQPTVDVPVAVVASVSVVDKNVYLLGGLTQTQLLEGASVTLKPSVGNPVTLDLMADNYGLKDWQTAYVDLTVNKPDDISGLTVDTSFKLSASIAAKEESATPVEGTGNVYVFMPALKFQDGEANYAEKLTEDFEDNRATYVAGIDNAYVQWRHKTATGSIIGTEPSIDLIYSAISGVDPNRIVTATDVVEMGVTPKIGTTDISTHTTFEHETCSEVENCDWATRNEENPDIKFLMHVVNVYGDLTITKSLPDKLSNAEDTFIFNVTGPGIAENMQVVIKGAGSVTIKDLKVGEYTVTEQTSWSFRYSATPATSETQIGVVELQSDGKVCGSVSFTNTRAATEYWLDGSAYAENKLPATGTGFQID